MFGAKVSVSRSTQASHSPSLLPKWTATRLGAAPARLAIIRTLAASNPLSAKHRVAERSSASRPAGASAVRRPRRGADPS